MFCKNCGREIKEDSNFCLNCGCALSETSQNRMNVGGVEKQNADFNKKEVGKSLSVKSGILLIVAASFLFTVLTHYLISLFRV